MKDKHFDRIAAIKRLSREDTGGPHGKAGPHQDKRERRERRKSTADWLAEVEEEMPTWFVLCLYVDDLGEKHSLGTVTVEAKDKESAIKEAMDRAWDPRLESASCMPAFEAELMEEE